MPGPLAGLPVGDALKESRGGQLLQTRRGGGFADPHPLREVVEPAGAEERLSHDQQRRPRADDLQAGGAPMLDMTLFRSRPFSAAMFVAAVSLFGFTGVAILSVLFYERVQRLSALDVGWRLLAFFGVYVVVAYATGRLIRRTGFKLPLTLGFLVGAAASAGFVTVSPNTPYSQVWWLYVLFGAACGMVAAPSTAAALVSVSHERAGMASGAVNAFRQIGSVTGSSLLGALLAGRLQSQLPARLDAHHVPRAAWPAVEHAVSTGSTRDAAAPSVTAAVGDAFTSGVHAGMAVVAVVFLCAALSSALLVHNRPHHTTATAN
jgi:DHA2 family methylenomycin A resistance protein-like MFS transporter/DHA2 family multidrug resistance protein-like MFS transporter